MQTLESKIQELEQKVKSLEAEYEKMDKRRKELIAKAGEARKAWANARNQCFVLRDQGKSVYAAVEKMVELRDMADKADAVLADHLAEMATLKTRVEKARRELDLVQM